MNRSTNILDGTMLVNVVLADSGYNYYGYVRHNGEWVIMRQNVAETEYRYKVGASGYTAAWTAHGTLSYGLPVIG